jgi:hypothetical protein
MKSTVVMTAPDPGAEALIREARRHQRRRYAVTGAAVAAALGATLGTFASLHGFGGSQRPRPPGPGVAVRPPAAPPVPGGIPASVDATVLMWPSQPGQDGTVALDNLRTGTLRLAGPVVDPGEYQPIMLVSGWIVYVSNNRVWAADAVTGRIRSLGQALAFAPSATQGQVWLEYGPSDLESTAVTIRAVSVSSGRPGPPITLPGGTQLVAGTDAGLLLEPRAGEVGAPLWLWTPGTVPRTLPSSSAAEGFAVSPRLVAFGTACAGRSTAQNLSYGGNFGYYACRTLRVLDVVTGRLKAFATPPGTTGWAPTHGGNWAWSASEISPSGRLMAAQAVLPPDGQGITRVFILHLTGPDTRAVPVPSSAAFLLSVTAWSPDSSWLFYQGPGEHMWAYQVTTGQARSSTTTCCQYAVMASLRSPPSK